MQIVVKNDEIIASYDNSQNISKLYIDADIKIIPNNIQIRKFETIIEKVLKPRSEEDRLENHHLLILSEDAYEDVETQIDVGFKKYSELELDINQQKETVSLEREKLLNDCLWILERHQTQKMANTTTSITDEKATEWALYVQALRDITSQQTYPASVTWPLKPE